MKPPAIGRVLSALLLSTGLAFAAGCSKDKNIDPPAELTKFESAARIQTVWSASAGGGEPKMRLGLSHAIHDGAVFAADHKGNVSAFSLENGKRLWRTETKMPLTAGPGAGEGLVVAGASHGDMVALDAKTGEVRWKARINSELLSAPAIVAKAVALRAVDGRVVALSPVDGKEIWSAEQQVPRLSLRGTARPAVGGRHGDLRFRQRPRARDEHRGRRDGLGITGFARRLAAPSSSASSTSTRPCSIVGDDVYAVTYQGRIARLARDSGQSGGRATCPAIVA